MSNIPWIFKRIGNNYALLLLLVSGSAVAPVLTVFLQKYLIDDVLLSESFERLIPVILLMAGSMAASDVLYSLVTYFQLKMQARFRAGLISEFYRGLYRMPMARLHNERLARWLQNATSDAEDVSAVMALRLPDGWKTCVELALLAAIIGVSNPPVLALIVVVSPIYIMLGKYFAPKLKDAAKVTKDGQARLLSSIEEGLAAMREIVAFHRQAWAEQRFQRVYAGYFQSIMREGKLVNTHALCSDPVKWSVHLAVLGFGGFGVIRGTLSIGQLVVMYQLSVKWLEAIRNAYSFSTGFSASIASVDRFREALDEHSRMAEGTTPLDLPVTSVEFHDVCFRYEQGGGYVLNGVSFSIPIGRKAAIVGESGCGKSTIIQLLMNFYKPQKGMITVNGIPLHELRRKDWMRHFSIVFQEPFLFPDSIRRNLLMGRTVTERELKEACQVAQIHDTIESLPQGYDTVLGERGITLSGGQRQRLAIARSLLTDAEILVLDEATSALDAETERLQQDCLDERRRGRTTLLIAHRLSTIRNADVIFVLHQGRIVEQGTHEELMANGSFYNRMFAVHV